MNSDAVVGLVLIGAFLSYEIRLIQIAAFSGRVRACVHADTCASFDAIFPRHRTDCDFGLLWETQIFTLRVLQSAGAHGVSMQQLETIFQCFSHSYPELSDGLGFEEWLSWTNAEEITIRRNDRIAIAEKGNFILEDLERNHSFASHRCA